MAKVGVKIDLELDAKVEDVKSAAESFLTELNDADQEYGMTVEEAKVIVLEDTEIELEY